MDAATRQSVITPPAAAAATARPRRRERADGVRFELATPADDGEIRRLLRENPTPGAVSLSLEREPDARLAAALEGDVHHAVVARDPASGRLMGMGSIAVRDVYLNGEVTRAGYLGQLRLDRAFRARAPIVIGGYRIFRELHESLGAKVYLTSVAADNVAARRFLERGVKDMPRYRPLEPFVTSLCPPRAVRSKPLAGVAVQRVGVERLPDIVECLARNGPRFQFAPVWREGEIAPHARGDPPALQFITATRGGRVVGCTGVWDQWAYKQTVVRGYAPRLRRWRHLVNLVGRALNVPYLPPVGTPLDLVYLSHVAVDGDDPAVFAAMLRCACSPTDRLAGGKGTSYAVLGLSASHPLLRALPPGLRRHAYRTNLYAVHWDDGAAAAAALDGRPCQPEVALL